MKKIYICLASIIMVFFLCISTGICQPTVTNGTFDGTTTGWGNCGLTGPEMTYPDGNYGNGTSTDYAAESDNGDSQGLCQTISGFTSGASAAASPDLYIYLSRRTQGTAPSTVGVIVCLTDPNNSANSVCQTFTRNNTTFGFTTFTWNFATPTITSGTSLILSINPVTSYYTPGSATCPIIDCSPPPGCTAPQCSNNYGMIIQSVSLGAPTPVTLLNFTAVKNGSAVVLDWQTETELNNDYFVVEKSKNGIDFTAVNIVDGAGNSQSTLNYQTTDHSPYNGISYYRLKQTDFDGKVSYSRIEAVNFSDHKNITIYPNPGTGIFNIQGLNAETDISVENPLGQVVLVKKVFPDFSEIDLSSQPSGVYFVKVNDGSTSANIKIILHI